MDSSRMITACNKGTPDSILHILRQRGFIINNQYPLILHVVSSSTSDKNKIESLDILVNIGANINQVGIDGITPLMQACVIGGYELIKSLLSHGANVRLKNNHGREVFHFLATRREKEDMKEIVDLLLQHGGNINAEDNSKLTPLTIAWQHDRPFALHAMTLKCITSISLPAMIRALLWYQYSQVLENFPQCKREVFFWGYGAKNYKVMELALEHGVDV